MVAAKKPPAPGAEPATAAAGSDAARPSSAAAARRGTATRSTTQGAAVRQALREDTAFRSAQDIYATLRGDGQRIGLATVYRRLQAFEEEGLVDVIHNPDGETVYRLCGAATAAAHHHHHLVCRNCGHTEEIEGSRVERWLAQVTDDHGYTDVDHTLELFGLCPRCSAAVG